MLINNQNHGPRELEAIAVSTINSAHEFAIGASDVVTATVAQAMATVGLAQATLASSAWNIWLAENRR